MAKNKDNNEDPEEEKNNQFEDDDDFGLPDLDYDELEEEADQEFENMAEEPELDDVFNEEEIEVPEEDTPEESPASQEMEVEADLGEELGDDDWEKDLEMELDEEMKSGSLDESFYEEESFEEFQDNFEEKPKATPSPSFEEEDESVGGSVFGVDEEDEVIAADDDSDDFYSGIDEPVEAPKPAASETSAFRPSYADTTTTEETAKKGGFTKLVVIGTLLFLVVGAVLFILFDSSSLSSEPKAEKPKPEAVKPKPEPKPEPVVEKKPEPAKPKKPVANTVAAGEITKLPERNGKSYIIIASFFDGDMADDYAKKLSGEGKSPYIIPPFKDHRFYRVAIAEYENFIDAKDNLATYQGQYGADVWPLRY